MTGPVLVFAGPTITDAQIHSVLPEAIVCGPAEMGDVLSAVQRYHPHAVGLVDGTFLTTMSVFHKELLYAIDQGTWVLGASSMGALRAAECARYGMIGVGRIYEALVSGTITDDDEVALAHAGAEHGYVAISDPLVNVRATLERLVEVGALDPAEAAALVACQRRRWFPDRHLADVAADARMIGIRSERADELGSLARRHAVDVKQDDAIAMLERIACLPPTPFPETLQPGLVLSAAFATTLELDTMVWSSEGDAVSLDDLRRYVALHHPSYHEWRSGARLEVALCRLSEFLGGPLTDGEVEHARQAIAASLDVSVTQLDDELAGMDLDARGIDAYVDAWAHRDRLERSQFGSGRLSTFTQAFTNALRRDGSYQALRDIAAMTHSAAEQVHVEPELSAAATMATYEVLTGSDVVGDLAAFVDDRAMGSVAELLFSLEISVRGAHSLFDTGFVELDGSPSIYLADPGEMTRREDLSD